MALTLFSILCSDAIVDQRSNHLSLLNVIEEIHIKLESIQSDIWAWANNARATHVCVFARSSPDIAELKKCRNHIFHESGAEFPHPIDMEIELNDGTNCRLIVMMDKLPFFSRGGIHYVVTRILEGEEWVEAARYPYTVKVITG